MSGPTQRRLAAIVSADVVGYSRLMGQDEVATLESLRAHRAEMIDPLIETHGGRVVKTMGDGLLLEFPSAVNATLCSIEVQRAMVARNDDIPEDRRIALRIGTNLGEIIFDPDGDIHGDGVNVAARLEALAEPSGICISDKIHAETHGRLDEAFADGGAQAMKNIAQPVRIWHWSPNATAVAPSDGSPAEMKAPEPRQDEKRSVVRSLEIGNLRKARELAQNALELQPRYGDALSVLAMSHAVGASMGLSDTPIRDAEEALRFASEALKDNTRNNWALCARGIAQSMLGMLDPAVESLRLSISKNPNNSFSRRILARLLCYRGDYEEALREAELSLKLSPRDLLLSYTEFTLGFCHFASGDPATALEWANKVMRSDPDFAPIYLILAAAAAELDKDEIAEEAVNKFLELKPGATVASVISLFPATDTSFAGRYRAGLTKAGLPD